MSQVLMMALIISLPLAALALLAAWSVERMGAGLRLRLAAWTAALLMPAAVVPAMLAIHALDVPSPFAALEAALAPEPAVALVAPAAGLQPAPRAMLEPAGAPTPAKPGLPIAALLLGLVGAGAAVRLSQLAVALRRVARLRATSEAIADPDLARRLGGGVRLADTSSPVLAGLVRPTILLPRRLLGALSADQAALVCAHERAHLAAGDHLAHLLEETMVRAFWFNPFLAAARERLAAAREEACDARALEGCDAAHRRAYAQTLIAALRLAGRAEPVAAFTGFRRRGAERRLRAILKPPGGGSRRAWAAALLAGAGLAALAGGVSLAAAAETPAPASSEPLAPLPSEPPLAPLAPLAPEAAAPPGHPHVMIIARDDKRGSGRDRRGRPVREESHSVHSMVFEDQDFQDGHLRPEVLAKLPPEDRARVEEAMQKAHDAMARAHDGMAFRLLGDDDRRRLHEDMARVHAEIGQAMAEAHQQIAEAGMLTAEERAHVHERIERALKSAHQAMAQNDGRVLMRCKLGARGKAEDCIPALGPAPFVLFREGHEGGPMPPAPPAPHAPPALG